MIFDAMNYADRYREELTYFRTDLPILTGETIEQRCRTLSLLLTAAVRCGEIPITRDGERVTCQSLSHDAPIYTSLRSGGMSRAWWSTRTIVMVVLLAR